MKVILKVIMKISMDACRESYIEGYNEFSKGCEGLLIVCMSG